MADSQELKRLGRLAPEELDADGMRFLSGLVLNKRQTVAYAIAHITHHRAPVHFRARCSRWPKPYRLSVNHKLSACNA